MTAPAGEQMSDPSLPASTTPVQDYLDRPTPGATVDHLVVPRSLAQSMPLRWQQVFVGLLADLHDVDGHLEYRDATDSPVPDPERHKVLAPIDDPLPRAADGRVEPRPAAPL